jgi:hypothetical protein
MGRATVQGRLGGRQARDFGACFEQVTLPLEGAVLARAPERCEFLTAHTSPDGGLRHENVFPRAGGVR